MRRAFAIPESNVSVLSIAQAMKSMPMKADHSGPEHWVGWHRERKHGSHCSCRVLASIADGDPSIIDYGYCRQVLQKRWRMRCDHVPEVRRAKSTPELPSHDPHDPVHALLIANADYSFD